MGRAGYCILCCVFVFLSAAVVENIYGLLRNILRRFHREKRCRRYVAVAVLSSNKDFATCVGGERALRPP